jgi:hypothetical protein
LSNVLEPTLDASQTVGGITKLCRKSGVDISRFGMFPLEKVNDYSLLGLYKSDQIRNVHSYHWKMPSYSSTGREGKFDRHPLKPTVVSSLNDMCHFLSKV